MKITLIALLVCFTAAFNTATSQQNNGTTYFPSTGNSSNIKSTNPDIPKFYWGFGTGINSPTGLLGPNFEFKVVDKFTLNLGLGLLSTWGTKLTLGTKYYLSYPLKSAFGLSFQYGTGISSYKQSVDVTYPNGTKSKETVEFELKPAYSVNLSWFRYWKLGRKSRAHLELGYAIPIGGKSIKNVAVKSNTSGFEIDNSARQFIAILQPGGIVVGVGLTFGL